MLKDAVVAHCMVKKGALLAKPCHDSGLEEYNLNTGPLE
jgi:hypothetical protein